jgi:osmotically-inducible protein OsmY
MLKLQKITKFLACLALIAAFMGCAATQKHESTGQYVDDSVITTKVKSLLASDNFLKSFQISVKTYQGSVQLGGLVDSPKAVDKADEIVKNVKGVAGIKNNLIVKQVREEYRAIEHQG